MSDEFWKAFMPAMAAAVPATVAALGGLVVAWRSKRQVTVLRHEVDGRLSELLNTTRTLSHAQGHADGVEAERVRPTDQDHLGEHPDTVTGGRRRHALPVLPGAVVAKPRKE